MGVKAENSTTVVETQQAVYAQDEAIVTSSSSMNQPNFKSKGGISINYNSLIASNPREVEQVMLDGENDEQEGVWVEEA